MVKSHLKGWCATASEPTQPRKEEINALVLKQYDVRDRKGRAIRYPDSSNV